MTDVNMQIPFLTLSSCKMCIPRKGNTENVANMNAVTVSLNVVIFFCSD